MNPDVVFSLVDLIYAAAVDPDRWQDFLAELSEAFGGAAGLLALQLPASPHPAHYYLVHLREELHPILERHYQRGTPWGQLHEAPLFRERFVRASRSLSRLFSAEEGAASAFYNEWMKPEGLAPEGPVAHHFGEEDGVPVAAVALYRRVGCRRFTDGDLCLANLLVPHLARAFRLYRRVGGAQHESLAMAEVMDRLAIGVVLVDRERRPIVSNRTADRLIALDDGLMRSADRLRTESPRDHAVLQRLLSEAIAEAQEGERKSHVMAISRPSGKRAFPVLIAPLLAGEPGDATEDAVVSVIIGDPEAMQTINPEILRTFYDLTPAEAELVSLLAGGVSLEGAAKRRGVTINTVRSQLKNVFSKTETNRQGELIRLVLTGAASSPEERSRRASRRTR
jgi:DNA-binding CsgD family transcriptional regulator